MGVEGRAQIGHKRKKGGEKERGGGGGKKQKKKTNDPGFQTEGADRNTKQIKKISGMGGPKNQKEEATYDPFPE